MNLQRLCAGLDVQPLLRVLTHRPDLWDHFTARQEAPGSAHHDTRCIVALGPQELTVAAWFNDIDAVGWSPLSVVHDALAALLRPLAQAIRLTGPEALGRVMIVELAPGGAVDPHADEGAYAEHYARFHIVLSSAPGNRFTCGGESVWMRPGEAWWFDHQLVHDVVNASAEPRVHVIVDAVSPLFPTNKPRYPVAIATSSR